MHWIPEWKPFQINEIKYLQIHIRRPADSSTLINQIKLHEQKLHVRPFKDDRPENHRRSRKVSIKLAKPEQPWRPVHSCNLFLFDTPDWIITRPEWLEERILNEFLKNAKDGQGGNEKTFSIFVCLEYRNMQKQSRECSSEETSDWRVNIRAESRRADCVWAHHTIAGVLWRTNTYLWEDIWPSELVGRWSVRLRVNALNFKQTEISKL